MNKLVLSLLLAFSSVLAFGSGLALPVGKVTRLMTKDLPDVPGKEGMVETVDFAPGEVSQPHRHNADLFVYVLEGSVITQVKGGSPQTVHAGEVFYESPTDVHIVSRNASDTQPAKLLVFYVKAKGTPPTVLLGDGESNTSHEVIGSGVLIKPAPSFDGEWARAVGKSGVLTAAHREERWCENISCRRLRRDWAAADSPVGSGRARGRRHDALAQQNGITESSRCRTNSL